MVRSIWSWAVDLVAVAIFCLIGRHNHAEAVFSAGLLRTLWPFAAGLVVGRLVVRNHDGLAVWPTGVAAWLGTLVGGMALRAVSGQGVEVSFVIVAGCFTSLFLVGWRAAAQVFDRVPAGPR
jgi:hypothetical protein